MLRALSLLLFIALLLISPFCWATDHVLFSRAAPSEARLFISNTDGSGERALTQPGALDYNPSWSPSGDWIVFTSERAGSADLYRIHPDGTGLDRLTDDPAYDNQGALSPDGKQVVFVSTRAGGRANLWVLDVATRKARLLTSGDGGDFRPAWSPDGKWIAFSSDRGSSLPPSKGRWERLQVVDIYLIRPDGTGLKRISEHGNFCGGPKWTRDSKSVTAYCMSAQETWTYRWGDQDGEKKLVQIDAQTGAVRKIGDDFEIFTIRPDGEDVTQLTHTKGNDAHLGWSPDGERIVFTSSRMGFKDEALNTDAGAQPYGEIFVMRYDGTQVEQLTDNQWEDGGPSWQPQKVKTHAATGPVR